MTTIPFSIKKVYADLAEGHGMLRQEGDYITLEFQIKDAVLGIFKSKVKEITLNLKDLESIQIKKKLFKDRLILCAKSMKPFEQIPGSEQGILTLLIQRKHRKQVARVVLDIELRISELAIAQLDNDIKLLESD